MPPLDSKCWVYNTVSFADFCKKNGVKFWKSLFVALSPDGKDITIRDLTEFIEKFWNRLYHYNELWLKITEKNMLTLSRSFITDEQILKLKEFQDRWDFGNCINSLKLFLKYLNDDNCEDVWRFFDSLCEYDMVDSLLKMDMKVIKVLILLWSVTVGNIRKLIPFESKWFSDIVYEILVERYKSNFNEKLGDLSEKMWSFWFSALAYDFLMKWDRTSFDQRIINLYLKMSKYFDDSDRKSKLLEELEKSLNLLEKGDKELIHCFGDSWTYSELLKKTKDVDVIRNWRMEEIKVINGAFLDFEILSVIVKEFNLNW